MVTIFHKAVTYEGFSDNSHGGCGSRKEGQRPASVTVDIGH